MALVLWDKWTLEKISSRAEVIIICLIQDSKAYILSKVDLKIESSGIILKTITHAVIMVLDQVRFTHRYAQPQKSES